MLETTGDPVAILYGLSALDPINQIAFAVVEDAKSRPDQYGESPELERIAEEVHSNPLIVVDLDQRTELTERISGSRDGILSPLAVTEFAWRDAALAVARSDDGRGREVAKSMYARSAESFGEVLDSARDVAQEVVEALLATFDASSRILADRQTAAVFEAEPLPSNWVVDEDVGFAAARTLANVCEELEPEPFGRLSPYELQVLKRLSVRRRRAVQMFADGKLDPGKDPTPFTDWAQALEEFRLANVARALRGQRTVESADVEPSRVAEFDVGFLAPNIKDFITTCAAGGT